MNPGPGRWAVDEARREGGWRGGLSIWTMLIVILGPDCAYIGTMPDELANIDL